VRGWCEHRGREHQENCNQKISGRHLSYVANPPGRFPAYKGFGAGSH
jgi:hypothetical protein